MMRPSFGRSAKVLRTYFVFVYLLIIIRLVTISWILINYFITSSSNITIIITDIINITVHIAIFAITIIKKY